MLYFLIPLLATVDFAIPPVLPKQTVIEPFQIAASEFEDKWDEFAEGKTFAPFATGRSDEEIFSEFENLNQMRYLVWYRDPESPIKESNFGYEVSLPLIFEDAVRPTGVIAFEYNNVVPYYNASAMTLGKRYVMACEGPRSQDVRKFFTLLTTFQVTHLVRLTPDQERGKEKCHPYWEGLVFSDADNKSQLFVPLNKKISKPIQYFAEENWQDNTGFNAGQLLDLVIKVRDSLDAEAYGLLTVHCSAGAGRTGTFLAALDIVDAIDQNQSFSIEEIVLRLSLQRLHSVAKPSQYLTLYRLAEEYQLISANETR